MRITTSGNGANWTFIDELALGAPCVYAASLPLTPQSPRRLPMTESPDT